jgi:hypothetical protein
VKEFPRHRRVRDGVEEGLVSIFAAADSGSSFVLRPGEGNRRLRRGRRKCQHWHFYSLDPQFRLIHLGCHAEVAAAPNARYRDALAAANDSVAAVYLACCDRPERLATWTSESLGKRRKLRAARV